MTAEKAAPDATLEELIAEIRRCGHHPKDCPLCEIAWGALREYLSERTLDTQRLDWLIESGAIVDERNSSAEDGEPWQCTIFNGGFGTRSDFFWGATPREVIDKARASMKEP